MGAWSGHQKRATAADRDADELAHLDRKAAQAHTTADGASVRPSTQRAGYVEVIHAVKPPDEIRAELKAAGFRWAVRSRCWYGPGARLPARYRETVAQRGVAVLVALGLPVPQDIRQAASPNPSDLAYEDRCREATGA